MKEKRGHYFFP